MIYGSHAALSAMNGFSKTMAVAANNIANASSSGFKKSRVVLEEGQNGEVETYVQEVDVDIPILSEETSVEQTKEASNVDISEEMVYMVNAQLGYEANLKSLQAQEELQGSILDILG